MQGPVAEVQSDRYLKFKQASRLQVPDLCILVLLFVAMEIQDLEEKEEEEKEEETVP